MDSDGYMEGREDMLRRMASIGSAALRWRRTMRLRGQTLCSHVGSVLLSRLEKPELLLLHYSLFAHYRSHYLVNRQEIEDIPEPSIQAIGRMR